MTPPIAQDPIVRAAWHPVARLDDFAPGSVRAVRLLDRDLVLWRGRGGLRAWDDLCLHRGVRLSLGTVTADCRLRCAYHGWTYDDDGQCIAIPAHPGRTPPSRARAHAYPCREAAGLLWVTLTENTLPPPFLAECADPAFRAIPCGPYPAPAGVPRLIENFLDVAHLPIVHDGSLGTVARPEIAPYEVDWVDGLPVARDIRLFQPNPEGFAQAETVSYEYGILSPFAVYLRKRLSAGRCFSLLFAAAPVTETESTAWFTIFLNYGEAAQDRGLAAFQQRIFAEDLPIVASQRPERLPLDLAEELHLPSDRLAIAYRKYIRGLGLTFGTA